MTDIDQLAATFEQLVAAINQRDIDAYSSLWHDQIVGYPPFSPFAMEGKATLRQLADGFFANAESLTLTPVNPQYRVVGDTGIVWGHLSLSLKPTDGPHGAEFLRFLFTFANVDGKWLEFGNHVSYIPSGT